MPDRTDFRSLIIAVALAFAPGASRAQQALASEGCPASTPAFRVGHTIEFLNVTGTLGETRPIRVHVWYPARERDDCDEAADFAQGPGGCEAPVAVYTSRLNGVPLLSPWVPLSWTIAARNAFESPRVARGDGRFPVIIFSHGNTADAGDYAYTLEALASYGYVVAAPDHLNNTQDDVRIDFVNPKQAAIACFDGLPSPCSHASVPDSMVDRYRDIEAVLDKLITWFGPRIDMERVGIMGHSRGTVTALSVAGGSHAWGFNADPRIRAVMGMAIGAPSITFAADVQNVSVPVLLVGGTLDVTSPLKVSKLAIDTVASTDKQLVTIENAVHRHFESALCAVMQSSGAIAQNSSLAVLDHETARQIVQPPSPGHPGSGVAMDFCGFDSFTNPTDITSLVRSITGFDVTPSDVPTHGLTSDTVKAKVVQLAVSFFARVLNRADGDDRPFSDCLPDEFKNQPPVPEPTQQDLDDAELHADDPD